MFFLPIIIIVQFFGGSIIANKDPIVETSLGKLRGYTMTSRSGRNFYAFSGIPYAKPPVGELRFQAPEALSLWSGIRDALKEGPKCLQYNTYLGVRKPIKGVEDCLYLSVFSHNVSSEAPVLVHFHGGGFTMGYSGYYGPDFLMDEDIVIVKVNYRLGILGFLSFETPEMPGNQGMKDQVMALQWVKQNIASFGGNPNLITIIGESAGGSSVYHHIISPMSKGLFHRAVSESGTSYSPFGLLPPGFPRSAAKKLMALLNCPFIEKEAIRCIMNKDPEEIVSKIANFTEWRYHPFTHFGPSIEPPGPNSFIADPPSKWNHNPVPLIIGMSSAEGLMETSYYLSNGFDFKWLSKNYNRLAPFVLLHYTSASNPDEVTHQIRQYYLPNEEITVNDFVNLTMVYSDSLFTISVLDGANKHKGDVYFYYFDHKIPFSPHMDEKFLIGATHCAETQLIWNLTARPGAMAVTDPKLIELSKNLVKIIGNFMKNGIPTIEGSDLTWKKWTSDNNNYIHIDSKGFHEKESLAEDRYKFWKGINYNDKMEALHTIIANRRETQSSFL